MKYENDKFYISKQELEDLDKIAQMIDSPDIEQSQLGLNLYNEIVLKDFKFCKYKSKISKVYIPAHDIYITRRKFIIT